MTPLNPKPMVTTSFCVLVYAEIDITVDVDLENPAPTVDNMAQAVQDAIGHTGAKVIDVTDWEYRDE